VRVVFTEGSGCYGHNGADDVAGDAALLSQAVGRPVRVQWSREDENAWEPEGPAMLFEMAGAVGADGKISAWTYDAWTPTHGYASFALGVAAVGLGTIAVAWASSRTLEAWSVDLGRHLVKRLDSRAPARKTA